METVHDEVRKTISDVSSMSDPIETFSDGIPDAVSEVHRQSADPIEQFSDADTCVVDTVDSVVVPSGFDVLAASAGSSSWVPGCSCIGIYGLCLCGGARLMRP